MTNEIECQRTHAGETVALGYCVRTDLVHGAHPSDTPDGTRISNTATVGGQRTYESPNDLANNTDTDEAIITTRADLELVKTLDAPLVAGQPADYTLVVTNKGPSTSRATAARPIRLVDTLPAGTTFVSASPGMHARRWRGDLSAH